MDHFIALHSFLVCKRSTLTMKPTARQLSKPKSSPKRKELSRRPLKLKTNNKENHPTQPSKKRRLKSESESEFEAEETEDEQGELDGCSRKGYFEFQALPLAINNICKRYEKEHRTAAGGVSNASGRSPAWYGSDDFVVYPSTIPKLRSGHTSRTETKHDASGESDSRTPAPLRKRRRSSVATFDSFWKKSKERSVKKREKYWAEKMEDYAFSYHMDGL